MALRQRGRLRCRRSSQRCRSLVCCGTEIAESIIAAFRRGLSDSGYTDGKNVTVDIRVAEGKRDRLSELAADLVRKRVAAIVVNTNAAPFAISATKSIPIVFVIGSSIPSRRASFRT